MDERLRSAERSGDPGAVLRWRMRAGQLTPERVTLAARLGHPVARQLYPDVEPLVWEEQAGAAVESARKLVDKALQARVTADWAERVLPRWEGQHPTDARPRVAIAAARAWAACPCAEHEAAAEVASAAAEAAAYESRQAAPGAPSALERLARAIMGPPQRPQDLEERDPARLACKAADSAASEAYAGCGAASGASNAAAAAEDPDAERVWQALRLAAYLLDEVEPGPLPPTR